MTGQWRARVEADITLDGVAIHLRRWLDDERLEVVTPLSLVTLGFDRVITEPGTVTVTPPMLRLSDEQAQALHTALDAHFGDAHTIRAELAALNAKLDLLIERTGGGDVDG